MATMARALLLGAALLVAALAACGGDDPGSPGATAASTRTPATVARVVDGDTLIVRLRDGRRRRVRLIGIDTPETKRPGAPVDCGGPEASAAMRRLALEGQGPRARGVDVVLVRDGSQDAEDRFGRLLAYVDASDGAGGRRDLGHALVRAGWARERTYDGRYARRERYRAAQDAARRAGLGIWALCR
jgi:micrococcal nuclease